MNEETSELVNKTDNAETELEKDAWKNQNPNPKKSRLIYNPRTRTSTIEFNEKGQEIAYHPEPATSYPYNYRWR